jgi:hypothetical protein
VIRLACTSFASPVAAPLEAHRAGIERVVQASGMPIGWVSLACELQRDWNRQDTVPQIVEIVLTERLLKE